LRSPETPEEQAYFLDQLSQANGVFFSGGDQSRIMETFRRPGGGLIREALTKAYHAGVVFGGTSAGTAIMSKFMIVGPPVQGIVPLARGLGLLPENVIVDQHFSQRNRVARLLKAQQQTHAPVAIGIDEDTALIVTDQKYSRVVGDHNVRIFTNESGLIRERYLQSGSTWYQPVASECHRAHANSF
jgi:cyanophycinase